MTTQAVSMPKRTTVTWGQVGSIVWPWRRVIAGALAAVAVGAALELTPSLVVRRLIDDNLKRGQVEGLATLALLYLAATAALQVARFATTYLTTIASQGALRQLRVRLFAHLQKLPIAYYDATPLGDVISRCTADMDTINTLFSVGVISVLTEALQLVSTAAAMIALSPLLAGVMLIVLPALFVITRAFQARMRDAERATRRAVGALNARLQETLTGVEVIHAFDWSARLVQRFRRTLAEALRAACTSLGLGAVYSPVMEIMAAILVAALFWLATSGALPLTISIGTLAAFVLLFNQFFQPIISIGNDWQDVQSALAGIERVFQVLQMPADKIAAAPAQPPAKGDEDAIVAVRDVVFGYFAGQEVLRGVSLAARAGEHIAIVGRTGAGKSSLFHLLGGLYQPWAGSICLAGRDPRALSESERRRIIGPVPQTVHLFSGTVRDNITLGDPTLAPEAVERAARIAGAEGFIRDLPQGYDTLISDRGRGAGAQLSAGQRQLLALARALAGDPAILLLDEATASIDSATEIAFREALRAYRRERGGVVLTIAHRLSTALEADYILVLEEGRVVEEGPTQALLRRGGRLASLWELETAGWEWRAP